MKRYEFIYQGLGISVDKVVRDDNWLLFWMCEKCIFLVDLRDYFIKFRKIRNDIIIFDLIKKEE